MVCTTPGQVIEHFLRTGVLTGVILTGGKWLALSEGSKSTYSLTEQLKRAGCRYHNSTKTWRCRVTPTHYEAIQVRKAVIPKAAREHMQELVHVEWIDDAGLKRVREEIGAALDSGLDAAKARSANFLLRYIDAVDKVYAPVGANGTLRSRRVSYAKRSADFGRAYACAPKGPEWAENEPSTVAVQGMSGQLRPFLLNTIVHDLDMENAHPTIVLQQAQEYHRWPEHSGGVAPLSTFHLSCVVNDRPEFIKHIADFHSLPTDPEIRKRMGKGLILKLMYGGGYASWLRENRLPFCMSKRVKALKEEILVIRRAFLSSKKFSSSVCAERARLDQQKGKVGDAADRSIFAKLAQHQEHVLLMAMRRYLRNHNWVVHSLVYDGLTVAHQEGRQVDLKAMEIFVKEGTGFSITINEKPLFGKKPVLDLALVAVGDTAKVA